MKRWMTWMLAVAVLGACKSGTRELMPGTYVNSSGGKYSLADDTLVVEPSGGDRYAVYRRTGFNLVGDGRKGPRKFERETWQAVYDEASGTLVETRRQKKLVFDADGAALSIGARVYRKID